MKIGLSLSGQPYSFEECFFYFDKNCKHKNLDVFGHFWWSDEYQNKCYKLHYDLIFSQSNPIEYLEKKFNIKKIIKEPNKKYDLTFIKQFNTNTWKGMDLNYHRLMVPIFTYGLLCQTDSVYNSCKIIPDSYDIIVRTRPDVLHTKNINEMLSTMTIKENTIYCQSSMEGGHLYAGEFPNNPCDWFYLGLNDVMKKFTHHLYHDLPDMFGNGVIHLRDYVKELCNKYKINLELIDFGAIIYKQTSMFDNKHKILIDHYINDFDQDECKVKTPNIWPYWLEYVDFKHFKNLK